MESAEHFIAETMWPRDRSTWVRLLEARDRLIAAAAAKEAAKRERERCAKACEGVSKQARAKEEALGLDRIHERNAELAQALGALECRDAIRALPDEEPST